jgi:hypothetical protein
MNLLFAFFVGIVGLITVALVLLAREIMNRAVKTNIAFVVKAQRAERKNQDVIAARLNTYAGFPQA